MGESHYVSQRCSAESLHELKMSWMREDINEQVKDNAHYGQEHLQYWLCCPWHSTRKEAEKNGKEAEDMLF